MRRIGQFIAGKKFLLIVGLLVLAGTGSIALAPRTFAAGPVAIGGGSREEHYGYFKNIEDEWGSKVFDDGVPDTNVNGFINRIEDYLTSGKQQERVGARFIIYTMLSYDPGNYGTPSAAIINTWEDRVRDYSARGLITWNESYTFTRNSYYQGTGSGSNPVDDAVYKVDSTTGRSIVFRNTNGVEVYAIKHDCGNPVGSPRGLPALNWAMTGSTTVVSGSKSATSGNITVAPGANVVFKYTLKNSGPATSDKITWHANNTISGAVVKNGAAVFDDDETNTVSESVTVPGTAVNGTRYCRNLTYSPRSSSSTAGATTATVCAVVAVATPGAPTCSTNYTGNKTLNAVPGSITVTMNGTGATTASPTGVNLIMEYPDGSTKNYTVGTWSAGTTYPKTGKANATSSLNQPGTYTLSVSGYPGAPTVDCNTFTVTTPPPPAIIATCTASPNTQLEVNTALGAISIQIVPSSGTPPATASGIVRVTAPSGAVIFTGPLTYSGANANTSTSAVLSEAGTYTIAATYPPDATFGTKTCGTFTAAVKTYFEVLGGDVVAGSGYGDSCAVPTGVNDGRIDAFNRDGAGSYKGSATNLAIMALKNIKGAASGTLGETGAVTSAGTKAQPTGLDFANTGTPGNFGNLGCAPDYAGDALAGTITHTQTVPFTATPGASGYYVYLPGAADPDGTYVYEFNNHASHPAYKFTLFGGTVPAGKHFTLVFKGALGIVGNIDYAPYTSLADAPNLTVISTGDDLGIHQAVTSLSGFYVAQNGTMTTCNQGDLSEEIINPNPGFCNQQLTIYGALAAKDIRFDRTSGSLDGAPAEKIIFSPELWAAGLSGACSGTCSTKYDAITSLPPVL